MVGHEMFDTIIAMNVLEHLQDDDFVLQKLYRMLKKGGVLILLVPAYKSFYNVIDVGVGHFRSYPKHELEDKVRNAHFKIEHIFYFNILGIVGGYLNGNLAKKNKINAEASKIFDRLVPFLRSAEKTLGNRIGLSTICYQKRILLQQQYYFFSNLCVL
jgi:SAM-dependent methyltransferase